MIRKVERRQGLYTPCSLLGLLVTGATESTEEPLGGS
jgi:hypothetical protein